MAGFIQIIEFTTSRFDEFQAMAEEFRGTVPSGGAGPIRITVTEDRERPGTYLNIVEFESYESAMENSNRPETGQFAEQLQKLCDGPPKFYNLDVRVVPEV
jgi:quinol monooxygenase YgiN